MLATIPADYIGDRNLTYCLAAFISEENQHKIALVLDELDKKIPGVLWKMPQSAMHITLCEIIQPKAYNQDKKTLFETFMKKYGNTLAEILLSNKQINITFDAIEASEQAIIIRGNDGGSFDKIRSSIVNNVLLPTETKRPPNIVHSSIARYLTSTDLAKVQDIVATHKICFNEQVAEVKLIEGLRVPLLDYVVLRSYPLT